MTAFADLAPYHYRGAPRRRSVLAVGWLGRWRHLPTGKVPSAALDRLWKLVHFPVRQTRGLHVCQLCSRADRKPVQIMRSGEILSLGAAEIRVFSDARIYASPDLIVHYIEKHRYAPPDEFIHALVNGPAPYSEEYFKLLLEHVPDESDRLHRCRNAVLGALSREGGILDDGVKDNGGGRACVGNGGGGTSR